MTQRLRDNQALCEEVRHIIGRGRDAHLAAENILDAVDRALTATGPGSGHLEFCDSLQHGPQLGPPTKPCNCAPYRAPQTDHRAAPVPTDDGCYCDDGSPCRVHGGVPPVASATCSWCGGKGWGLLDEAGVITCPRCKGTGRAAPPSGSPPAVTEPLCVCPLGGPGGAEDGCPRHDPPSAPATAPGEPVTSGSPPGAAEAEPWVIVAAHLSTEGVAYFWGPSFSGYTRLVEKAGRYTEAEAKSREVWSERMEVAVPRAEAIAAARLHVSDDDAHAWFRRRFPGPKPAGPPESPDGSRGTR